MNMDYSCSYFHIFVFMENVETKTFVLDKAEAEKLERIAFILKTVAHPIRLGIIRLLEIHETLSVSDICSNLKTEQSLTSHHLQNMKLKGILQVRREGRSMMYSLKEKDVTLLIQCLENCSCNVNSMGSAYFNM